ncbi:glycosyltransferase [Arenimonas sp.]|nr:glycosyltransferase [Candidatus Parcubacteria bacterium]
MCTYNRAHFIKQAIDSVLSQTFQDWELLIVDDCSTDNTKKIISTYSDDRIRYIQNPENLGITENRNKALSLSTGEYVAVLDSDDYWIDTNKLSLQNDFLDQNNNYALIGSNMIIVDEQGKTIKKVTYPYVNFLIKNLLLMKNLFCHSSVLYRKQEILNLGGYDVTLPIWEDYDMWLKIGLKYKLANLSQYTTAYRKHTNQSNSIKIKIGKDTQKFIIEKYKKSYLGYNFSKTLNTLRNILR